MADLPKAGNASFTRQQAPLGLGHAVWCARELVGDEPFAVLLPDMVTMGGARKTRCLAQCVEAYEKHGGNIIAVEEVPPEETHQYGIVAVGKDFGHAFEIKGMVEKPPKGTAPSNLIISGRYILQPEIFALLETSREGRRRRDPAHRRHDRARAGRRRSTACASTGAPTIAARRSASSPPTSPSRWNAPTSRRIARRGEEAGIVTHAPCAEEGPRLRGGDGEATPAPRPSHRCSLIPNRNTLPL